MRRKSTQTAKRSSKKSQKKPRSRKGKRILKGSAKKSSNLEHLLKVDVQNRANRFLVRPQSIRKILALSARHLKIKREAEVSVLFINDSAMKALNYKYRKMNKTTDVLSFPMNLKGEIFIHIALGDIVVSLDKARAQAATFGVTLHEEVCRLLIHGFLHLLGYDHEGVSMKVAAKMRRAERAILIKVLESKLPSAARVR